MNQPEAQPRDLLGPYIAGSLIGRRLIDVLGALLKFRPELKLVALSPQGATLLTPSEGLVRLFAYPEDPHALSVLIERCLEENPGEGTDLVLVGGEPSESERVEAELPRLLKRPFRVHHVPSEGAAKSFPRAASKDKQFTEALRSPRRLSESDILVVLQEHVKHVGELKKEGQKRRQFFDTLSGTKPRVTQALLAALGVFFLLQLTRIVTTSDPLVEADGYLRMGALSRLHLLEGEWWRLISAGFLHGGVMHLASNGFVLYLLGGQTEKIIGSRRFFIVYMASLIGGSLSSALFLRGYSVGASGAIWGILGAQAALGFGKPEILPESIRRRVRSAAMQNLGLNLVITFMVNLDPRSPIRIDWAAHLGGGITGALVLGSGLLFLKEASGPAQTDSEPSWLRSSYLGCLAVMGLALFLALTRSTGL